ncbi:MAG: FAD-binding protein [Pseudomonadota bacterium]|nr:FAD-binding protein [Pseudomonadota bacterium]
MNSIPLIVPWTNWIGDYASSGLSVSAPRTKEDLVQIVETAIANGQRLRAVGAAHSTTSVARPDDLLVSLDAMQGTLPLDYLKPSLQSKAPYYVRLLAGTRLKYANRVLLGDKAVLNMGSFDWQSLIGAILTGTHGSSIYTGPMAESVRSIEMVTVRKVDGAPEIRLRRIEPANGITDPAAFERDESKHDTELIQDDDTFSSAVVSFGSIGLVYSLTLEVTDEYWLKEDNRAIEWNDVKDLLRLETLSGFPYKLPRVLKENRFWEFLVNCPEAQGKDATRNPMCFVRYRNLTDKVSKPDNWKDKYDWPPRREKSSSLQRFVEDHVRPSLESQNGTILLFIDIGNKIRGNFERTADDPPFEGKVDYSRNYWVLRRERDDTKPQEEPERPSEAISTEIAVPLENTVAAVDRILDIMARNRYFYAVPFGVRFVAPSRHYLAMQYDRPTCMIEIPMLLPLNLDKRAEQMSDYKASLEEIEESLCYKAGNLGGRPHWGQYNALTRDRVEDLYAKLPEFERVYSTHNAFGTFDNMYTRQIGLVRSELPAEAEENPAPLWIAAEQVL